MTRIYTHPLKTLSDCQTSGAIENLPSEVKLSSEAEVLRLSIHSHPHESTELFRFGEGQKQIVYVNQRFTTSTLNAATHADEATLTLVMVPHHPSLESSKLIQKVQAWAEMTGSSRCESLRPVRSVWLTLQGVQIVWQPDRAIVFAEPNRMDLVCQALIEATHYERQLRQIELEIDRCWEQTQTDSILAFDFSERDLPLKASLSARFQEKLSLRVRLARLTPQILVPHVYPPTIASQIGERLRERTRMPERLDLVDEKLEAQEHVYELCTQRAGEYLVARKGHILEWVIIVLLFIQTLLWVVDYLASSSQ
jgi:hypothetical protein